MATALRFFQSTFLNVHGDTMVTLRSYRGVGLIRRMMTSPRSIVTRSMNSSLSMGVISYMSYMSYTSDSPLELSASLPTNDQVVKQEEGRDLNVTLYNVQHGNMFGHEAFLLTDTEKNLAGKIGVLAVSDCSTYHLSETTILNLVSNCTTAVITWKTIYLQS